MACHVSRFTQAFNWVSTAFVLLVNDLKTDSQNCTDKQALGDCQDHVSQQHASKRSVCELPVGLMMNINALWRIMSQVAVCDCFCTACIDAIYDAVPLQANVHMPNSFCCCIKWVNLLGSRNTTMSQCMPCEHSCLCAACVRKLSCKNGWE